MKCPVCEDVQLSISSREGVEIDYCAQCRGVWLDRGELDKIIERAGNSMAPSAEPAGRRWDDRGDPRDRYDDRRHESRQYDQRYDDRNYKKKKRKSFLDDLFDFD